MLSGDSQSSNLPPPQFNTFNMLSLLGTLVPEEVRGILYICQLDFQAHKLAVVHEVFFASAFIALEAYSNIPNPESQLVSGGTYELMAKEHDQLAINIRDPKWVEELENCI